MPFWSRRSILMAETDSDAAAREAKAEADLLTGLNAVFGPEPPRPGPVWVAKPRPLASSSVKAIGGRRHAALGRPHWKTGEWS